MFSNSLIRILACWLLLCLPVSAQVPMTGAGVGAPASGGSTPVWTATDAQTGSVGFANFQTWISNVTAGLVVVGVYGSNQGVAGIVASVTVGGVNFTKAADTGNTTSPLSLWYGTVSSGGSQSIIATLNIGGQWNFAAMSVGTLTGLSSTTPTTTATGDYPSSNGPYPTTSAITVPSSGYGIVFCGTGGNTITSSSSTFTVDLQVTGTVSAAIGNNHTTGAVTPSFNGTNFFPSGIAAATWH